MTEKVKFENIPKHISGTIRRTNEIVLCTHCNGFGFIEKEAHDYHKRETNTFHVKCSTCEGDGRMIKSTDQFVLDLNRDKIELMPYPSFKEFVDPYGSDTRRITFRLDKTDNSLEKKYPELAAVNYDNYDRLVEHYRVIETLKKEEMNG